MQKPFRIFIFILIIFQTSASFSFSQTDSLQKKDKPVLENPWIPIYAAGSYGAIINYKNIEGNFGSVSAGIYLGQIERSSIFFEIGNYERTTTYLTVGLSLAVLKFNNNNIISPEGSVGFIGTKNGHGGVAIAFIPSLKYLHRFHNLIAATAALKYSPFGQYLFLNFGIQVH